MKFARVLSAIEGNYLISHLSQPLMKFLCQSANEAGKAQLFLLVFVFAIYISF